MTDQKDDLSSAPSDGATFTDVADSLSPEIPASNGTVGDFETVKKEGEMTEAPSTSAEKPNTSPRDVTSPSSNATTRKVSGVAALRAKFQGSDSSTSQSPNVTPKIGTSSRHTSPSTSKKIDTKANTDNPSIVTSINGESIRPLDGGSSSGALQEAVNRIDLADDKKTLPPSRGAMSLLDPEETIKNPFYGSVSPSIGSYPDTPEQSNAPLPPLSNETDVNEPKRFSIASEAVHDTPTPSQASRFSSISLNTTVGGSHRDTLGLNGLQSTSAIAEETFPSPITPNTEFLARQSQRLSKADGGRRSSMEGAEKIMEKVKELRYGQSHRLSVSRKGEIAGDIPESEAAETSSAMEVSTDSTQRSSSIPAGEAIDWDFWGSVMSNYQEIAQTQPRQLSRAIQAGIPGALRGMMWQLMSSSKDEEMEIIYSYYLKQTSPHEKMIRKDLARTFPGQEYFQDGKGIGQENLFNVVKAYSLYDEECGYCQGMQFVVGPLLLNMPDEEAFSTLVRLMKSYDLRGHFVPNMPALQLRLFQFDRLLEESLPLLHRHLVRSGVKSSMYASGWFMTLFSYRSPLDICFRILDSVFAEGIEALFRFALALMKKNEDALLELGFDEAVPLLAARVFDVYKSEVGQEGHEAFISQDEQSGGAIVSGGYRVNEFVNDAFNFKITPFQLDTYANDFAEQVKVATAHRREMDEIRLQNKHLQVKVKNLEDQLGGLQQEHVDLVKSVVMAKLAKEEMAEELVRYKLMYAEATLLADQGGVNGSSISSSTLASTSRKSS